MNKFGCSIFFLFLICGGGLILFTRQPIPVAKIPRCQVVRTEPEQRTITGEPVRLLLKRMQFYRIFTDIDKFGQDLAELVFWGEENSPRENNTLNPLHKQTLQVIKQQFQNECIVLPVWLNELLKTLTPKEKS